MSSPWSFSRRADRRLLAGVAGGFADRHGIDAVVVRCAIVVLTFAGGLGVVLYALGALLSPGEPVPAAPQVADQRRNVSVGCITLGVSLVVRSTGLWLGDGFMGPLLVVVAGIGLIGVMRPELGNGAQLRADATTLAPLATGRRARVRLFLGAGLVALGLVLVASGGGVSSGVRVGAWATAITIVGVALALGPWLARLAQEAAAERRERIRATERAAMAAHLHDSVLQTLALIQRNADDPRRTITLARQQERELREWLYGTGATADQTLGAAVRTMAHDVEAAYDVRVELVVVGDARLDSDLAAFVASMREACVNAAKHSGVADMSVFVEVSADAVEAFVRDRGTGFDRDALHRSATHDRRGIAESIEARLERVGGTAVVDSTVGAGTEVRLHLPRRAAKAGTGDEATVAGSTR
jgi:signal transduction histidine kinase/phage shock protein PspC (stress-responsive transcriptional regulator)